MASICLTFPGLKKSLILLEFSVFSAQITGISANFHRKSLDIVKQHLNNAEISTDTYMWTSTAGHEGDLVFISGRLRSASGRLFDGIFNASFQTFFNKIRKEF